MMHGSVDVNMTVHGTHAKNPARHAPRSTVHGASPSPCIVIVIVHGGDCDIEIAIVIVIVDCDCDVLL